ncbi:MAG TPA: peptide MFS transporter, partial [Blastocatellia bacterium]|nr:peptide MFS transporter [Blastocatellia bacterium]
MATQASSLDSTVLDSSKDTSGIGGHPRGLTTLFFTEMWERFSYYGMRALLILYMTTAAPSGGLGFDTKTAASIYGAYTGSVYLMSIPGGWFADNVLGTRRAVFVGGVIIALGHYSMAVPTTFTFFMGLVLIVLGTGLLKPNVSAIVGELYSPEDQRRDAGFSIFYVGINIGAFTAPLVTSYLGEKIDWHLGFGAAGVGMTLGLIQYVIGRERLAHVGHPPRQTSAETRRKMVIGIFFMAAVSAAVGVLFFGPEIVVENKVWIMVGALVVFLGWLFLAFLKPEEKKPVGVIVILFLFSIIFWACYEQAGSSFNLFARDFTNRFVFGREFPAGYYQSSPAIFVVILTPIFVWLWQALGDRQPSSPVKFSFGLLFVGLGAAVIATASLFTAGGAKVGPYWLLGVYALQTIGEICLYPVGLSTTTKLAPHRLAGLMMGVWFLSISFGNFAAGIAAGHFEAGSQEALVGLFSKLAAVPIIAALALLALTPLIKKLMGKVR